MSEDYQRIELITGTARRRRWTTEQKLRIIEASYEPGESVSSVAPDEVRLFVFAERLNKAKRPMLVFGPEVDRSGGWDVGVAFAEKVQAEVYGAPLPDRVSFPENHPLYRGELPMTIAGANEVMRGHDLVMVIGAQVFRYYPYVAGDYLCLPKTSSAGFAVEKRIGS
jgi:thiamine pyrophosphate-dependent acetolactate synthase large subunit-like protein